MLSVEKTLELIAKAKDGSMDAKTTLINENSPLVKSVIKRYKKSRVDYEDLYQLGCVGFLKAIKNFDTSFGVRFSTYAVPMIAGEVKRFLRDDGSIKVSRSIKTLSIKINRFIETYTKRNFVKPKVKTIAGHFEVSEGDVVFAMDSGYAMLSLDERQDENNSSSRSLMESIEGEDKSERLLDLFILKDAISQLKPRDKHIIIMRYFRDKTQSEIATQLGVSQVQVSRLESRILDKMRASFRT
jgi:RNA polymerase sporulation-specific sigma factor